MRPPESVGPVRGEEGAGHEVPSRRGQNAAAGHGPSGHLSSKPVAVNLVASRSMTLTHARCHREPARAPGGDPGPRRHALDARERRAETVVGVAFALAALVALCVLDTGVWHVARAVCAVLGHGAGHERPLRRRRRVHAADPAGLRPADLQHAHRLRPGRGRGHAGPRPAARPPHGADPPGTAAPVVGQRVVRVRAGRRAHGGRRPPLTSPGVVALALGAQFLVDFAASCVRERLSTGALSVVDELRLAAPVLRRRAVLAPIGVLAALAADETPWAAAADRAALWPARRLRPRAPRPPRAAARAQDAYAGPRSCSGTSSRPTTATPASTRGRRRAVRSPSARARPRRDRLRNLEFGALLHDVGKIAIPKEIINKPGTLDPTSGRSSGPTPSRASGCSTASAGFMREVGRSSAPTTSAGTAAAIPTASAGEAIPLEARIITCCDSWNAMRTDRSYRDALPRRGGGRDARAHRDAVRPRVRGRAAGERGARARVGVAEGGLSSAAGVVDRAGGADVDRHAGLPLAAARPRCAPTATGTGSCRGRSGRGSARRPR